MANHWTSPPGPAGGLGTHTIRSTIVAHFLVNAMGPGFATLLLRA